jgi:uncharacterized membrane protein YeaQ/YmgE (transglycosylase-associated protein family)
MKEIEPGGYLFYDNTRPLPPSKFREDVNVIGMPLTAICNRTYADARQRQLFKNIMYIGALAALLDVDLAELEKLIGEQYKGKDKLIEPNVRALRIGHRYTLEHYACPIGLTVARADQVGERIFIDGNSACGLGAVYGGATVAAWYPITPSTSVIEAFTGYCKKLRGEPGSGAKRYAIVQAEDELAAIGMVVGAAAQWLLGGSATRVNWGLAFVAGLVGSFVGGLLASFIAGDGLELRPSGLVGSLVGAVIVTLAWRWWQVRKAPPAPKDASMRRPRS